MAGSGPDLESNESGHFSLTNKTVQDFSWKALTVTVKDRETKEPRNLIDGISGSVQEGEVLALMGPSGCGKTTLLNVLARRAAASGSGAKVAGDCYVNGGKIDTETFEHITSYVEQEDALIGSLTVQETLKFAADLSLPRSISGTQRRDRIRTLLEAFGIQNQATTLVGTPIRKGISGGQKRRVSVASQLITCPKILFLDEPTTGLDSKASYEVMSYVRKLAKSNNLIIIASIHQPSTTTFQLFDKLLLLSQGQTCYYGPVSNVASYFDRIGYPLPPQTNPAEFLLDLASTDFNNDHVQVQKIQASWSQSAEQTTTSSSSMAETKETKLLSSDGYLSSSSSSRPGASRIILSLLHRSFIKSHRDVVAYGIRIVMYLGLAIMMGTVWLRLGTSQEYIQPFINAIFFGSAFMSFMAVAYVPAFLEDRATFAKERANGLYGAMPFVVANFIIGLPFLFIISTLFSLTSYFLTNFRPSVSAFWTWVLWVFLDLLAAESLVVFITAICPNFVIALAVVAFANGLWMSVGGFLVSPGLLNVFWRDVFHWIDYQGYVFQGMMVNEFGNRNYSCSSSSSSSLTQNPPGSSSSSSPSPCQCMYQSDLASQCLIRGTAVLETYGYGGESSAKEMGKWVGILVAIIFVYRVLAWGGLVLRR